MHILTYFIIYDTRSRTPELYWDLSTDHHHLIAHLPGITFFYIFDYRTIIPLRINDDQYLLNAYAEKYAFLLSDI